MPEEKEIKTNNLIDSLLKEKETALSFQKRRHEQWDDNYQLYRNKVKTNRLTQRQAVNIPLMKETVKTLLSKIDEPPSISFEELVGDEQKEIYLQAKWDEDFDRLNMEGIDIQDKKTALLYGRPFKKLNLVDGNIEIDSLDIYDVVIDPLVNPLDIETARFLVHLNIFRSLRDVVNDERYSAKARKELKDFHNTEEGIIQSQRDVEELKEKQERLKSMDLEDEDLNKFPAGDVLVNLTEHYTYLWDEEKKKNIRYVIVYANDRIELLKEPLKDLIGVDFLPFVTWAEDLETQDFWSDSPADLVRVPNKLVNIWLSQMTENRTLKNFQMHWYDATHKNYKPQTYEPKPGSMLPAPGDPNKTIKPVEVSGLEDCLTMIDFLTKLVEKGTSATAIEKGVSEKKQITLGEVEMLVGKAMEKTRSMAKFYRRSWKELAQKWYKILDANTGTSTKFKLYKKSSKGKLWPITITGSQWKSEAGYKIISQSTSEQEEEKTKGIQRLMFIKTNFPNNQALQRIVQRRTLELGDFTPDELKEIEEFEKRAMEKPAPLSEEAITSAPAPKMAEQVPAFPV